MHAVTEWIVGALLFVTGAAAQPANAHAEVTIPILVYHRFGLAATELTTIRTETFAQQLEWLHANGVAVLPLHEVVERERKSQSLGNAPGVVLTADDGHGSIYTDMFPLIQRYGVHVTLFVYPSAISNSKAALTWDRLAEMQQSRLVDVQSHTFWHPDFHVEKARLDPPAYEKFVRNQFALSKSRIESHLNRTVDLLAWPFGIHEPQLEAWAADAGYVAAFGIDRQRLRVGQNLFALPRFEVTDADRGPRFAALVTGRTNRGAG